MARFIEVIKHYDRMKSAINAESIESVTEYVKSKGFGTGIELVQITTKDGRNIDVETSYEDILQQLKEEKIND